MIIGGFLVTVFVMAGGAVALAVLIAGPSEQTTAGVSGFHADVGVSGPLGPAAFSALPSYFKTVTFERDQLSQFQDIDAHLPVGKYLVTIRPRNTSSVSAPDCMGVSFPLTQSVAGAFQGYVSVAANGDATTVSCYQQATTAKASATYDVFYLPITHEEPS
jgi:hypothetical protein